MHVGPPEHAFPQAPQWALLLRVSVSQPFAAAPSQSAVPAEQAVVTHRRSTQVAPGPEHAVPQAPQWVADVRRSVSHPLAALPSQFPKPS